MSVLPAAYVVGRRGAVPWSVRGRAIGARRRAVKAVFLFRRSVAKVAGRRRSVLECDRNGMLPLLVDAYWRPTFVSLSCCFRFC